MQTISTDSGQQLEWPFPNKPARDVQLAALTKGFGRKGFAYFMRQRLGKTLTAFAEFKLLRAQNKAHWFFVVCPNSLKEQWVAAIEEVDPFIPIRVHESQRKGRTDYYFQKNKKGGVFILNYESVQSFIENEGFAKIDMLATYLVFDESTKIKDFSAKMTKACIELSLTTAYSRVLTGRPTANSNADLWSQLKVIGATTRNFHQHKFYYCMMGGWMGKQVISNINTETLQNEIAPHCYIAEDKYVKGFEKVYEPIRVVNLSGTHKKLYKQMEDEFLIELADGTEITAPIVLVKYLRLQQISSGIVGDQDGKQHNIVEPIHNGRIQEVLDILENEIENKVIIPCRFSLSILNLKNVLTRKGYKVAVMEGGTKDIEGQKAMFNNDPDCRIMLAQLQVLSYGHTLCGTESHPCDSMIFYENDFSLLNRAQAESRPEAYQRDKPISYYDLASSKMDKYILRSLIRKEEASLALLNYARSYGMRPDGLIEHMPVSDTIDTRFARYGEIVQGRLMDGVADAMKAVHDDGEKDGD